MTLPLILGIIGATIALCTFILNEFGKLDENAFVYDFNFFFASCLLFYYALHPVSVPFLILNAIWGLVAFRDVVIHLLRARTAPIRWI